jgi:hypothetical protein
MMPPTNNGCFETQARYGCLFATSRRLSLNLMPQGHEVLEGPGFAFYPAVRTYSKTVADGN